MWVIESLAGWIRRGLVGVAQSSWEWLRAGNARPPIRAALIRLWVKRGLLRVPVPLTGTAVFGAEPPTTRAAWVDVFLAARAREAADYSELLRALGHEWATARARAKGRRRTSRATAAVDVLAAVPLVSAATLARAIGMSVQGATDLLDGFTAEGIVVEVTHRAGRRLFGLKGMAPVGDGCARPTGRSRGAAGADRCTRGSTRRRMYRTHRHSRRTAGSIGKITITARSRRRWHISTRRCTARGKR